MKFFLKRPDRHSVIDVRMNHFSNVERDTANMKLLCLLLTAKKTMAIIQQFTPQFFFSKIFIIRKYIHNLRMIQTVDDNKGLCIFLFCNSFSYFLQLIEYLICMYMQIPSSCVQFKSWISIHQPSYCIMEKKLLLIRGVHLSSREFIFQLCPLYPTTQGQIRTSQCVYKLDQIDKCETVKLSNPFFYYKFYKQTNLLLRR